MRPLVRFITCPSLRRPQISLSFFLPSLSVYTILMCLMCAVPFAEPVMSISVCLRLVCISSPRSSFHICYFPLVPSVPPSDLSLLSRFFPAHSPPSVYSFSPNPPMGFIGAVSNSLPTHCSWLRCSTTLKYNIESVVQKHYRI